MAKNAISFGIEESKELLTFGFDLQDSIIEALKDGKINLMDAPKFLKPLLSSGKAFGGINQVGAEILDLDNREKDELLGFVRQRFDLPDEMLEILIEDTLAEVLDLYKLALRWSSRKKAA